MTFDVNQTEFPSEFQKKVWIMGKRVLPLEVTLTDIDDLETREGCIQIYNFTQEILEDMYINPSKYTDNRPFTYSVYLFNWMLRDGAVPSENGLCWIIPVSQKNFENHFSYLAPFGFTYVDKGEYKIMSNDKYPLLLKYWRIMEQLGPKGSAERWGYIQICDFRLFSKTRKNTLDDLLRTISDRNRLYFKELHDYVINKGAKREPNINGGSYKYKNERVLVFDQNISCILIPYFGQLERFINEAKKQPDKEKLISYIQNELVLCRNCGSKNCSGRSVEVEGVKRMICVCHEEIGKLHKPDFEYNDDDITMLKRLIDIKFSLIDK